MRPRRVLPFATIDGRTKEGRMLNAARAEFRAHVGGTPSAAQVAVIEQLAQLKLRLSKMDATFLETGEMSIHYSKIYLAWSNSYARLLNQLGLRGAKQAAPTLAEHITRRREKPAAADAEAA